MINVLMCSMIQSFSYSELAHHLQQCTEEFAMAMNKMIHAKRLIREMEGLDDDDR